MFCRVLQLKARDMVTGSVTYRICEDDEQPKNMKGGQGIVKKAYTKDGSGNKTYFAIKAALNPTRNRQEDEAAIYFKLDPTEEPHLAFLSEVVMYKQQPLLVIEFAETLSLADWLEIKRKLPPGSVLPKVRLNKNKYEQTFRVSPSCHFHRPSSTPSRSCGDFDRCTAKMTQ
jgi:hypothetical protein